jgi:hypothetical protein
MNRNKELFFDFNTEQKNKLNLKTFKKEPCQFNHFKEIISNLKNVNIDNEEWLNSFYNDYINNIFPEITSRQPSNYTKYFWNLKCLNLDYQPSSTDFYISRGWSMDEIKKIRSSKYATSSIEFQKQKYNLTDNEACEKIKNRQIKIKSKRKETYKKYLDEDPDYFKKISGYSITKFITQGHSSDEAERLYKQASLRVSAKNKKWAETQKTNNPEYWNSRSETQLQYWINKGYTENEAKLILKDRQTTFSLEKCIKKYGEVEGTKKWVERQEKWKAKVFNETTYLGGGRSYIASNFIDKLIETLKPKNLDVLFGNKEKHIRDKNNKITYKYDFTYLPAKKIIEFNGDYWHCNPQFYKPDYYHKIKKMTAQQIWEYDRVKIKLAEQYGYNIMIVTEYEWVKNPELVLNNCLNFLND